MPRTTTTRPSPHDLDVCPIAVDVNVPAGLTEIIDTSLQGLCLWTRKVKISTGINGFGRFGMHLLRYWILNADRAQFTIDYINDEFLSLKQVEDIIIHDRYLAHIQTLITFQENGISISLPDDRQHHIYFSQCLPSSILWLGKPTLFLECSGKYTNANNAKMFNRGNTRCVIISASSSQADQTLIYGFNHKTYSKKSTVISYGSCTVNAYVPLANFIHSRFGIVESDVHVIHNVPVHKLLDCHTPERRSCTLQWSAINILPFITPDNFNVTYTLIPYLGVSLIDFRFHLQRPPSIEKLKEQLTQAMEEQELGGLYRFEDHDTGPEVNKFTPYSAVIIKNSLNYIGHNLYFQAYFDNENSATRYFDLVSYLSEIILS